MKRTGFELFIVAVICLLISGLFTLAGAGERKENPPTSRSNSSSTPQSTSGVSSSPQPSLRTTVKPKEKLPGPEPINRKAPNTISTPPSQTKIVLTGFCCKGGTLAQSNKADCIRKRGGYYTDEDKAKAGCTGFCCRDGKLQETTKEVCIKTVRGVRGKFFADKKIAVNSCRGWCCDDLRVSQMSAKQCTSARSKFFGTKPEADRFCNGQKGWCCVDDTIRPLNRSQCAREKGTFAVSSSEARLACKNVGQPGSSDRSNSSLTPQSKRVPAGTTLKPNILPDLEITRTWLSRNCVIQVDIKNNGGPISEQHFNLARLHISAGPKNTLPTAKSYLKYADKKRDLLKAGGAVSFNTGLEINGTTQTLVWVDTDHHIQESNETNNGDDQNLNCRIPIKTGNLKQETSGRETLRDNQIPIKSYQRTQMAKGDRGRTEYEDIAGQRSDPMLALPGESLNAAGGLSGNLMENLGMSGPEPSQLDTLNLGASIEVIEPGNVFLNEGQMCDIVWDVQEPLATDCVQIKLYELGPETGQVHVLEEQWLTRTTPGQDGYHWNVPANYAGIYKVIIKTCDNSATGLGEQFMVVSPDTDLVAHIHHITPDSPDTGNVIRVVGSITNIGLTPAPDVIARFAVLDPDGDEHVLSKKTFPGLSFGQHHSFEQEYRVNRKGNYENKLSTEVYLLASPETQMDNNEHSLIKTIKGRPDLVVCFDALQYSDWGRCSVGGRVYNFGDEPSGETSVIIGIEKKGTTRINVPSLKPSHDRLVSRSATCVIGGNRDFYMDVDPENIVDEINDNKNRRDGNLYVYYLGEGYNNDYWPSLFGCSASQGINKIFAHPYRVTEMETDIGVPVSGGPP